MKYVKSILKKILGHRLSTALDIWVTRIQHGGRLMCDWTLEERIKYVMKRFKAVYGYTFDIYNPTTFTEKVQWYRVIYSNLERARAVDKALFKDFVRDRIGDGYTIPLYGVWSTVKDLENSWNLLPKSFVLKSTGGCNSMQMIIIKDKDALHFRKIKPKIKKWLNPINTGLNTSMRAYYESESTIYKPRILAEKYETEQGKQLTDYKFFCFDGEPFCAWALANRPIESITDEAQEFGYFDSEESSFIFYDLDWNKLDVTYGNSNNIGNVDKPKHFNQMIEFSKKLSAGFPFVRVDFYDTGEQLYVGELTFSSGAGLHPFNPPEFDKQLGDLFILPDKLN